MNSIGHPLRLSVCFRPSNLIFLSLLGPLCTGIEPINYNVFLRTADLGFACRHLLKLTQYPSKNIQHFNGELLLFWEYIEAQRSVLLVSLNVAENERNINSSSTRRIANPLQIDNGGLAQLRAQCPKNTKQIIVMNVFLSCCDF